MIIPRHGFGRDHEYDLKGATPERPAGALEGPTDMQMWVVYSASFQPLVAEHIFPTHGQFADYELGPDAFPAFLQREHK